MSYSSIRSLRKEVTFGPGDSLVFFGELFQRGYANGLLQEAKKHDMQVIYSTVGRRDENDRLRPLSQEELSSKGQFPLINVPLEAGFDLEPDSRGQKPVDFFAHTKLNNWETASAPEESWKESQKLARERFTEATRQWVRELEKHLKPGKTVLIAHLMAGGVLRTKILLPLMNRALKGVGDRFLSSEKLWNSPIGQLAAQNFFEVTAETFQILLNETTALRQKLEKNGTRVVYSAYGYHGTEVLVGHNYVWQTYTPYIQGWAKMRLENFSAQAKSRGVTSCVYNCPEILTNSSAIFSGVEVSLYTLLGALIKERPEDPHVQDVLTRCAALLKDGVTLQDVITLATDYLNLPVIRDHCVFEKWPQHNEKSQLETMLAHSEKLVEMHKEPKHNLTQILSEVVIDTCGKIVFADIVHPQAPVSWINHDVIAKNW